MTIIYRTTFFHPSPLITSPPLIPTNVASISHYSKPHNLFGTVAMSSKTMVFPELKLRSPQWTKSSTLSTALFPFMNVIPNIIVHPTLFSLKGSLDEERLSSLTHLVANCVVKEKLQAHHVFLQLTSNFSIHPHTPWADLITSATTIIWEEAAGANVAVFDAINDFCCLLKHSNVDKFNENILHRLPGQQSFLLFHHSHHYLTPP